MNAYSLNDPIKYDHTDISGNQYTNLMNWALDHSDSVMLVYRYRGDNDYWQKLNSIRYILSEHQIYSRSTPEEWPGTRLGSSCAWSDLSEPDPNLYIDFYAITPEIRQYVLSAGHIQGWLTPNRPEDIAFFIKGKCWFFTTIHEYYYTVCGLHPGTREKLESLGIQFDEYQISEEDLWIEPGLLPETVTP